MNKQEVMKHIRNVLTKELNEASRDSWIAKASRTELQNTHSDILEYLDANLSDDLEFKLTSSGSEENIRRIVRDEMHKVLRKEQHLQK